MTTVLAEPVDGGDRVRLRVLDSATAALPANQERFRADTRLARALADCPSIVPVLDVGETAGGSLFVVERASDDETLASLLDRSGPLVAADAIALVIGIGAALDALAAAEATAPVLRLRPGDDPTPHHRRGLAARRSRARPGHGRRRPGAAIRDRVRRTRGTRRPSGGRPRRPPLCAEPGPGRSPDREATDTGPGAGTRSAGAAGAGPRASPGRSAGRPLSDGRRPGGGGAGRPRRPARRRRRASSRSTARGPSSPIGPTACWPSSTRPTTRRTSRIRSRRSSNGPRPPSARRRRSTGPAARTPRRAFTTARRSCSSRRWTG